MTKHLHDVDQAPTGQRDVEVTPEMIEAGAQALGNYRTGETMHSLRREAEDVFLAMELASRPSGE